MLELVPIKKKNIGEYSRLLGDEPVEALRRAAEPFKGLRVLQLNATSYGGGVAELLDSAVPLMNNLGLKVDWAILPKDEAFFEVTKNFHNALQGRPYKLTKKAENTYLNLNKKCAALFEQEYDVVVVHDPQPAAVLQFCDRGRAKWVWRCHLDTSDPDMNLWRFLKPFVEHYDAAIFTLDDFIPADVRVPEICTIAPAIDPFTSKNIDLDLSVCRTIVSEFGVDLSRPILLQVSRFDPWKDPLGVLEVYEHVKKQVADLQLLFVGNMAHDDPEGWKLYDVVKERTRNDPDIELFLNLTGVHAFEVNCFQRVADVIIQKSIREGFGLVITEALWKRAGVVAGNVGGIPLQVKDGKTGFLATSVDEFSEKILLLLRDPQQRAALGEAGRNLVAEQYLIPRLVQQELELYGKILSRRA